MGLRKPKITNIIEAAETFDTEITGSLSNGSSSKSNITIEDIPIKPNFIYLRQQGSGSGENIARGVAILPNHKIGYFQGSVGTTQHTATAEIVETETGYNVTINLVSASTTESQFYRGFTTNYIIRG